MAFPLRRSTFDTLPAIPATWMHDGWLALMLAVRSSLHACPQQGRLRRSRILLPRLRSYTGFSPNGLRGILRNLLA